MPNPVVHFEIQSKEPAKSRQFYADLFGWKIEVDNAFDYGMVQVQEGQGIAGGIGGTDCGPNRVTFYVQVDDPQAYLDQAEKLGGKTVMPVTELPGVVTLAAFTDFEGNFVGLVKGE